MKSQGYILIVILIIGSLALYPLESWAGTADEYVFVVPVPKKSQEMKTFDVVPLLEIGDLPFPRPSRRQIIDADKGPSCLACHRLPYPTAPQKPAKPGEEVLSSIKIITRRPVDGARTGSRSPIQSKYPGVNGISG